MEMIVFVGGQGAGKSTFFRENFFHTHVRVNLDMLRTRNRENLLIEACIHMQQRFVIDNTNPTVKDRQRYFDMVRDANIKVIGYFFDATLDELLLRNAQRKGKQRVPDIGVRGTFKKLESPTREEGFDELFLVRTTSDGSFEIERSDCEV